MIVSSGGPERNATFLATSSAPVESKLVNSNSLSVSAAANSGPSPVVVGGSWVSVQSQTSGRYQHENLVRGKIYRFRVYAKNSKGRSIASSEASCAAR